MARRVLICGDSNGLPRPEIEASQTYPALLAELLGPEWQVENHSIAGTTTRALYMKWLEVGPGDVVVIQTGITEGAPRPVPWKLRQFIGRLGPLKKPIVKFLHHNRERLLAKRAYFMSPPEQVEKVIALWVREAPSSIVIMVPDAVGPAMEVRSPGAANAYWSLNERMARAAGPAAMTIDDVSLLDDGHHFDAEGHRRVAAKLAERLRSGGKNP